MSSAELFAKQDGGAKMASRGRNGRKAKPDAKNAAKEPKRRQRYVLFESADHEALVRVYAALRNHFNDWKVKPPTVIETRGSVTILKCYHLDLDEVRRMLNAIEGIKTLKTSGTLRKLRAGMPR